MEPTLEDLYQILKKNVESLDLKNLTDTSSVYSEEYDLMVYLYLNQATEKSTWLRRFREIRETDKKVSQLVTMQLTQLISKALGAEAFK